MPIVLCPFELTRQAPVALLAILLAHEPHPVRRSLLTWAPRAGVDPDTDDAPLALLRAWDWSESLWAEGLIAPVRLGEELQEEIESTLRDWSTVPSLRPLVEALRSTSTSEIERDIALGGVKPAIRVLVTALLESWVSRLGALWFGPGLPSRRKSLRAEAPVFRLSLPIPGGADGGLLLRIRAEIAPELDLCRRALADVARITYSAPEEARRASRDLLIPAFDDYAKRFNERIPEWQERAASEGLPLRPIEILMRADRTQPVRTLERAARALGGGLATVDQGSAGALALRPGLAISTRLTPWDVSPAPRQSASP